MFKKITNKRFLSLVLALIIFSTMFPIIKVSAASSGEYAAGCWAYAYQNTKVYEDVNRTTHNNKWIYPSEGITVLRIHKDSASRDVYYIQYSTTSGPKYGYVLWNEVCVDGDYTRVGIVSNNSTTYYTENRTAVLGSVNAGEIVSILSVKNGMYYIEYNVNSSVGRKRGYVNMADVDMQNTTKPFQNYWRQQIGTSSTICPGLAEYRNVYNIPNPNIETYATLAAGQSYTLHSESNVNGLNFAFITFVDSRAGSTTYGKTISGYILR